MERLLELPTAQTNHGNDVDAYPLLDALRKRRLWRFGRGMKVNSGPFTYPSDHPPEPLTEAEEASLAFVAAASPAPPWPTWPMGRDRAARR